MKTFQIEIVETLSRIVEVKADTYDEACDKVKYDYTVAKIVLDYDDLVDTEFYDITESFIPNSKTD